MDESCSTPSEDSGKPPPVKRARQQDGNHGEPTPAAEHDVNHQQNTLLIKRTIKKLIAENKDPGDVASAVNKLSLSMPPLRPVLTTQARLSDDSLSGNSDLGSTIESPEQLSPPTTLSSPRGASIKIFQSDSELEISCIVGRGSFCTVRQATCNGKIYAVKTPTKPNQQPVVIREARILSELYSDPAPKSGIVKFHGAIMHTPALVLEFYKRTLKDHIQSGPDSPVTYVGNRRWRQWAMQLCEGLSFLQSKNVVHCDIKSDNVFLDDKYNACIGDFSSAIFQSSENSPGETGSREEIVDDEPSFSTGAFSVQFSAPELLSTPNAKPTFSSDVYSLGLVLLHAATGSEPYQDANKSVSQKLLWARKGAAMLYCSDENVARMADVHDMLALFITHRHPLKEIIPVLSAFSQKHG